METKLTSLELHGYKTFAKQTILKFPSRITAIVGPNGSGKSNVADSIRWVLGEQSYSLLRAKKTEDMIYSGSENRARSGMASVSITFDNTSGWLPIDYSEVVLTRRAYRDGANEYLLNGQRVRLKDFHELLAKTGLGDRTYTIIGQGLVDVALSIKPDERRMLFEEAAGIGLYRTRKEEALKRLEATRRNLERAADILDEIRPRMKSLEKQASRVGEFKVVQQALKSNLKIWYGYQWYKAQLEISQTQRQLDIFQKQAATQQESIREQELVSAELQQQIAGKRNAVDLLHSEIRQIHENLQEKNQNLAILEERRKANMEALVQLQNELAHLEETIEAEDARYRTQLGEQEKAQLDLAELDQQHQSAKNALVEARQKQGNLSRERSDLQQQLVNLEKELVSVRSRKADLAERLREIEKQKKNNSEAQALLDVQYAQAQSAVEAQRAKVQSLEIEKNELAKTRQEKQGEINEIRRTLDENRNQINRLNLEKNKQSNRLELLRQGRESLAGFSEGAKKVLKSAMASGSSVKVADIATRLKVPEKYEKAIASALGEAVDLLIVRNSAFDEDLMRQISLTVAEKVAILPEKEIRARQKASAVQGEGVEGVASELVICDADFRSAVELLLGDYIVVTDLASALVLRGKSSGWNFVTLEGETILDKGVAVLGKTKSASKVSYSRLVDELEASIADLDKSLAGANELDRTNNQRLLSLEAGLNQLVQKERELTIALEKASRDLSAAQLTASKAQSQSKWLSQQSEQSLAQVQSVSRQIESLDEKETVIVQRISELTSDLNELRSRISQLDLQTLEQQFQYLETERKVIAQTITHNQSIIQDLEQRLITNRTRLSQLRNRENGIKQGIAEINAGMEDVRGQIKAVQEANEQQKRKELSSLEEELRELEKASEAHNLREAELQKTMNLADRQSVHFQLELARQQEKLQALRARIEDDFGMIELENGNGAVHTSPLPFPDLVIEKLPKVEDLPVGIEEAIQQQKNQLRRIGSVNLEAEIEYKTVKERYEGLTHQTQDLNSAIQDLERLIKELDTIMRTEFLNTFKAVSAEFSQMFSRLFNGGSARLILSDEQDPIEGGIEIEARLPGRREQGLVLLSGGERSLTAVALVFALLKISPTPFCVLDEVDAMLDESNVGRFIDLLRDLSAETQFLLITHNRNTVSAADVIYGVTMGKDSASQLISMKLDEVDEEYLK